MILIIGLPNSGKTTFSRKFKNVVHLDDFGDGKYKFIKCNDFVKNLNKNIVIEGVYNSKEKRMKLIGSFKDAKNICIWLDTSYEKCLERENKYRQRGEFLIKNSYENFQKPTLEEGWFRIIIIKEDKKEIIK